MGEITAVVLLKHDETAAMQRLFNALDFKATIVGPCGLTITAPQGVFAQTFGVTLSIRDDGVWVMSGGKGSRMLPKGRLPSELNEKVEAIEFESPPDFGPGNP